MLSWSFCSPPYFDISNPLKIPAESISNTNITQSWLSQGTFIFDYLCSLLYRHHLVSWMLLFSLYPGHFTPSSFPSMHHGFSFPLNAYPSAQFNLPSWFHHSTGTALSKLTKFFFFMLLISKDFLKKVLLYMTFELHSILLVASWNSLLTCFLFTSVAPTYASPLALSPQCVCVLFLFCFVLYCNPVITELLWAWSWTYICSSRSLVSL